MEEIKYIYFERQLSFGFSERKRRVCNVNSLAFKPYTDIRGYLEKQHNTEYLGEPESTTVVTEQFWVDLEKLTLGDNPYHQELDSDIKVAISVINSMVSYRETDGYKPEDEIDMKYFYENFLHSLRCD